MPPPYTLGSEHLRTVEEIVYLGVTNQSNLKFSSHVSSRISKAKQILGITKRTLFNALQNEKLLAYTSLCRPVEYAAPVWDPQNRELVYKLEMLQKQAVRFNTKVKGRESVTEARKILNLTPLEERRKTLRMSLLMQIRSKE